jgi:hypothetical protein
MYSILYCVSVILSIYKFITNIFLHIYFLHFIANIKEKKVHCNEQDTLYYEIVYQRTSGRIV